MAEDAHNVNSMNVKPGGAEEILRDTTYNGKAQRMYQWRSESSQRHKEST